MTQVAQLGRGTGVNDPVKIRKGANTWMVNLTHRHTHLIGVLSAKRRKNLLTFHFKLRVREFLNCFCGAEWKLEINCTFSVTATLRHAQWLW